MSRKYPGGLIRKTPPTITPPVDGEGGSAPGVWTLNQASYYIKQGTWPKPVLPRPLYAWGENGSGALGLGDRTDRSSPIQVGSDVNWAEVSVNKTDTEWSLALKTDGTLWAWGAGLYGQLGTNSTISRSSPTQVGSLTNWSAIATGNIHSLALKTDGTLWSWGNNIYGELGQNNTIYRSSPVQVGALTTWLKIAAGRYTSFAIKTDGTLWAWGDNTRGYLGTNSIILRSSPVQIGALTNWSSISALQSCLAIKTDGTMWSWGINTLGQLGQNIAYFIDVSSPVQVGALTTWASADVANHALATTTSGTLYSWGGGNNGATGQGDVVDRSSPVQVGALNTWMKVSVGYATSAAIKTDGTLWSWGDNNSGEIGTNNRILRSSPVQVGSLTTWSKVAKSRGHTLAITKG